MFDVRGAGLLSDAEFWAPIHDSDFPFNYSWHGVKDVTRMLASEPQDFVLSWCRTLGDKLNDLDPFVLHLLEHRRVKRSGLLDALGSVIDRGSIGYRQVRRDPAVWDASWIVDSSWAMLDVGAKALEKQTGKRVQIITSWSERRAEIVKTPQNRDWIRLH